MNCEDKMALFIGMLCGDGCLSISHNGEGYRDYPIQFYNNCEQVVRLFDHLFFELFGVEGTICSRMRPNRKEIWEFKNTSVGIARAIRKLGFPEGVKRDVLRVPNVILQGGKTAQICFLLGLLMTDGCIRKNGIISFHMGSKQFLEDISVLLVNFIGMKKPVKEFLQRERYKSYQLYLNNAERLILLSHMPTWDNGTPPVLSSWMRTR